MQQVAALLQKGPQDEQRMTVVPLEQLRSAIEEHPGLKWDETLADICGEQGQVLMNDDSDDTSKLQFGPPYSRTVWLPNCALIDDRRSVCVAPIGDLRPAVEEHPALK